ncbi:MAG: hypothetical protein D6808_02190 [Candidatus Dadabacteria bacterium]|nr:MAG: hypothetical protein D6808_02190 [Candidatus Dadabacteria bacterium]
MVLKNSLNFSGFEGRTMDTFTGDYILELAVSNKRPFPSVDLSYGTGRGYVPENELMRAIILRVIEDLKKGGELKKEALEFLFNTEDEEYIFSFPSICSHLGFNPDAARKAILEAVASGRRISTRRRAA